MNRPPAVILHGAIRGIGHGSGPNQVPEGVQRACKEWAQHQNKCDDCSRTDWYTPDVDWLCPEGRSLFKTWETLAIKCVK